MCKPGDSRTLLDAGLGIGIAESQKHLPTVNYDGPIAKIITSVRATDTATARRRSDELIRTRDDGRAGDVIITSIVAAEPQGERNTRGHVHMMSSCGGSQNRKAKREVAWI